MPKLRAQHNPMGKIGGYFHFDKTLLFLLICVVLFGVVAVFNASAVSAYRDFGNQYRFIKDHLIYLSIGFGLLFITAKIDYHRWYRLAIPLLCVVLVLLVSVFLPGIGVYALGARRWINLGFTSVQPTELAKLVLVIYLSAWFSHKEKGRLLPFLLLLGTVVALILLQPDMGTAVIILVISGLLYFISGAPLGHILVLIPIILITLVVLAVVSPYRFARITTFFNHNSDPLGSSYHIRQVLISLGSGGWFGVGLGKSRQKYEYLPEANTDSIFAIIAEEVGFVGAVVLISAFFLMVLRIFKIAQKAPDRFGLLLGSGIGIWFAMQTLINLGAMVALIPLTGVPLPLISTGGSNLISLLVAFGILLNISSQAGHKSRSLSL